MRFTYIRCSGQGLRFDIYDGNVRIAISHDETHTKMIVKLLNSKAMLDKARDEENEACAKICDGLGREAQGTNYIAIRQAIRARRMK